MNQTNENSVERFLEKNIQLKKIKLEKGNVKISSDSEVWIVQCPKKLNLKEFDTNKLSALAMPSGKVKIFPVKGRILVRDVLKTMTIGEPIRERRNKQIPLPQSLVQRHPLLGVDFQDKLILRKDVLKRLKSCHKIKDQKTKVKEEADEDMDSVYRSLKKQIKTEKQKKMNISNNGDSDLEWIKDLN